MNTQTEYCEILDSKHLKDWDKELCDVVKEVGASSHKLELSSTVSRGLQSPKLFNIQISFENGKMFGFTADTFRVCLDSLKGYLPYYRKQDMEAKINEEPVMTWKKYPEHKPTEYGKYFVYRKGCEKAHYETWNNTGWAYNETTITHWSKVIKPTN